MAGPPIEDSTFEYLRPSDEQLDAMHQVRGAALVYAKVLWAVVPAGPDRDHALRLVRTATMWANVAITRDEDGSPR